MVAYTRYFFIVCLGLVLLMGYDDSYASPRKQNAEYSCGGKLESEVWKLWDSSAKGSLLQQFTIRLKEQGDVYALYDVQTYTHNLVAMAQRCHRMDRLEELADVFGIAFASLEAAPDGKTGMAWVCKGGGICNEKNRLINHEVTLDSIQFLALTASVANSLARAPKQRHKKFVEQTAITSIQHLLRFSDANEMLTLDKQLNARAEDVVDGSSRLFFTDHALWRIAIFSDLAGILQKYPSLSADAKLTDSELRAMSEQLSKLLKFFSARIALTDGIGRNGQAVKLAEIDRGFWRLYADNKYAAYTGDEKPVSCIKNPDGTFQKKVIIEPSSIKPDANIGWDISHSRRLVHAFEAIERNRKSLQDVFGIEASDLPSARIMRAFARQLLLHVWNGDADFPLFSNYWSGANGWYRVDYDNGTPRCMEGYPPFGMSDSFATGGFACWAHYEPQISFLGRRLYLLGISDAEADRDFMDKYYPGGGVKASAGSRMMTHLMFWPSLVQ